MCIAMQGQCGQCGGNHQGDQGWFPRKLEIRSRGGELPLNLEGRGSLLTRSLKMKVFWAEVRKLGVCLPGGPEVGSAHSYKLMEAEYSGK